MDSSQDKESSGSSKYLKFPVFKKWCPCCYPHRGRKGYVCSKIASHYQSIKARRTSHGVNSRLRREARPEKFT